MLKIIQAYLHFTVMAYFLAKDRCLAKRFYFQFDIDDSQSANPHAKKRKTFRYKYYAFPLGKICHLVSLLFQSCFM